jgi:transmembrane sensor
MDSIKEQLVHNYLNNKLTEEEILVFMKSDDYETLTFFEANLKKYKAPVFDADRNFNKLNLNAKKTNKSNNYSAYYAIAASFLLFLSIGLLYFFNYSNEEVKISKDHLSSFYLPDSSLVFLNNKSKITYNSKKWHTERILTLTGEAFFEVKKGSKFTVKTALGEVSVLGTKFNVKQRNKHFSVNCYEGSVNIKYKNENQILNKNQTYVSDFSSNTTNVSTIKNLKPDWIERKLYFENVTLYDISLELQFYYTKKIVLASEVQNKRFTGYILLDNSLEQNIQMFCVTFNLNNINSEDQIELFINDN